MSNDWEKDRRRRRIKNKKRDKNSRTNDKFDKRRREEQEADELYDEWVEEKESVRQHAIYDRWV